MFSDSPQSSEGSHLHTVITGSSSAAPSSGDPRAHLEQPIIVTEDAQMEPLAPPRIKPTKSMPPEYLNDPLDPKSPGNREAMEVPQSAPVEGPRHVEVNLENNRRSTPRQHRSTSSNGGARADERGKPEIKEGQGTEPAVSTEWEYHRIDGRRGWEAVFWSFLANFSITSSLTTFSAYALYYQMSFSASDPIMLDDTLHGIHEPHLAGAAAGGAVMTFVCHTLLTNKGLATALRVQALIALVVGVVSAIGMQTRVMFTKPAKMLWNKTLRDTRTVVLMTVAFLAGVAHFAQHLCMPGFSQLLGMQGAQTLEVVYISSGATVVGLVLSGIVADRTGYIAGIGLSQFAMGVFTLALWLPAKSKSLYYAYAVVYGLTAGVLGAVVPASVVQMFGIARAFTMLGVTVSMAGLGMLLTLPAIINFQHQISEHKSVQYLIGISGGLSILSGIIALLLPYLQRRHLVRMLNKSVWTQQ
ncbi:hypothetical protein FBU59_002913 [Linderina macrospora]|uniref:Uncharacterized protein n=1 Tax=Linderina macrospora TaxID=4868 RepID=A0ACC1J9S6_9FUNG|nr:hypothetical protein FBU59_002913 [Linderina macrospora]